MNTKLRKLVTALSTAGVVAVAHNANAGDLYRIASDFAKWDGSEFVTSAVGVGVPPAGGGVVIYSKPVIVPPNTTSLYVTVSTTGDTHQGAAHWFACTIDGVSCRTSPPAVDGAPSGWISLLKLPIATAGSTNCNDGGGGPADCHDNNVYYTWCVRTLPSNLTTIRTARVKMATSVAGRTVFAEKAHFYVDANVGPVGECAQAPTPSGPRAVEPDTNQQ
jgi:hypothetical protein